MPQTQFDSARSRRVKQRPPRRVAAWVACMLTCAIGAGARAADECQQQSAELTTAEGIVEMQRSGTGTWARVAAGDRICYGDTLRTAGDSRATVTLPDFTTLRIGAHGTLRLQPQPSAFGSLVELIRGVIHVISRDPRSLSFTTPYANAGLEGTEFDIRVDGSAQQTDVVVLEGTVVVTAPAGRIEVGSGAIATARPGTSPTAAPVESAIALMRWAGHYPRVLDASLPPPSAAPPAGREGDPDFFAERAEARLATAQVDDARRDLAAAYALDPQHSTALAVDATIALAHGEQAAAAALADRASAASPASTAAFIAAALVAQKSGDFARARRDIDRALVLEPRNSIAWTLLAELALAQGDIEASIAHSTHAEMLAPDRSDTATARGFAELRRLDSAAARTAFERAIASEPANPLPHLGLSLALVQQGDFVAGRRQLELAVTLDPGDSLTRSYMAKVYNTEHRGKLTTTQLDLAKRFDVQDPTPWLYAAMQKLRANNPVEALQDLRAAAARNGGHPVLRSRLALDEDVETRSAGLGRLHGELGFERLGLLAAWEATSRDPSDFAGHRLLGDAYAAGTENEIARTSEVLKAQLLQPLNVTTVKPQLAQEGVFIGRSMGPSVIAHSELSPPVIGNGLSLEASAVSAGNGTFGADATMLGLHDRLSYSIGQYRFASDGFRINNDIDQRVASGFLQFRPSAQTSLQAEFRSMRTQSGDLALRFDATNFTPDLRRDENADSLRFGMRHDFNGERAMLASAIVQSSDSSQFGSPLFGAEAAGSAHSGDVLLIERLPIGALEYGFRYATRNDSLLASVRPVVGAPATTLMLDLEQQQETIYGYAHLEVTDSLIVTLGASGDRLDIDGAGIAEDELNPKLGILWRPNERTTIRAAAFSTLYASLTTSRENTQPRLEPFQIAGFSQAQFGSQGDRADVAGVGVDRAFGNALYLGLEASQRESDRLRINALSPFAAASSYQFDERARDAYVYWTPGSHTSFTARYERRNYDSEPLQPYGFVEMDVERLPIEARYFTPRGLSAGIRASLIHEEGLFEARTALGAPPAFSPGSDRFWVFDAFLSYRLPNRRGFVSLNADNLLDERFQFQDVDPEIVSVMPERLVSLRFTLSFD